MKCLIYKQQCWHIQHSPSRGIFRICFIHAGCEKNFQSLASVFTRDIFLRWSQIRSQTLIKKYIFLWHLCIILSSHPRIYISTYTYLLFGRHKWRTLPTARHEMRWTVTWCTKVRLWADEWSSQRFDVEKFSKEINCNVLMGTQM